MLALLDNGADAGALTSAGLTPLNVAVTAAPGCRIVRVLLDNGACASVGVPSNNGRTPLHQAALGGNAEAVEVLIRSGAEVNSSDTLGDTPLHLAIAFDHLSAAAALLRCGADRNFANRAGLKAFDCCSPANLKELVAILESSLFPARPLGEGWRCRLGNRGRPPTTLL